MNRDFISYVNENRKEIDNFKYYYVVISVEKIKMRDDGVHCFQTSFSIPSFSINILDGFGPALS